MGNEITGTTGTGLEAEDVVKDDVSPDTLEFRWKLSRHDEKACIAALRDEQVPSNILSCPPATWLCVLHGIRYHPGFATELVGLPGLPDEFRALNARTIRNDLLDIGPEYFPYSIWHPDLAPSW